MNQMTEMLRQAQQRMTAETEARDAYVAGLEAEVMRVAADRDLLARHCVRTDEFLNWLLEQDNSSTMVNTKPGMGYGFNGSQAGIEGQDDTALALRWADAMDAR